MNSVTKRHATLVMDIRRRAELQRGYAKQILILLFVEFSISVAVISSYATASLMQAFYYSLSKYLANYLYAYASLAIMILALCFMLFRLFTDVVLTFLGTYNYKAGVLMAAVVFNYITLVIQALFIFLYGLLVSIGIFLLFIDTTDFDLDYYWQFYYFFVFVSIMLAVDIISLVFRILLLMRVSKLNDSLHEGIQARKALERTIGDPEFLRAIALKAWYVNPAEVQITSHLGSGAMGEVSKAKWQGTVVAVKRLHTLVDDHGGVKEFMAEIDILSKCHHPNCLQLLGASLSPPDVFMMTEFCELGCLSDVLSDVECFPELPWERRLSYLKDAAAGMIYLHAQHPPIIHRDLKSMNLLVTRSHQVKVADFGLARFDNASRTMSTAGTPLWMAPEVLLSIRYSVSADVYSFGIIMFEVATRSLPYQDKNPMMVVAEIVNKHCRPNFSDASLLPTGYAELAQKCWSSEPEDRPSFAGILEALNKEIVLLEEEKKEEENDAVAVTEETIGEKPAGGATENE
jgi:hypothetical protein